MKRTLTYLLGSCLFLVTSLVQAQTPSASVCNTVVTHGCTETVCGTIGDYVRPTDGIKDGDRATGVNTYAFAVNDFSCSCTTTKWATYTWHPCVDTLATICPEVGKVYDPSYPYPSNMYSISSPTGEDDTGCEACDQAYSDAKSACESGTPIKALAGPSKDGSSVSSNSTPSTVDVGGGCSAVPGSQGSFPAWALLCLLGLVIKTRR